MTKIDKQSARNPQTHYWANWNFSVQSVSRGSLSKIDCTSYLVPFVAWILCVFATPYRLRVQKRTLPVLLQHNHKPWRLLGHKCAASRFSCLFFKLFSSSDLTQTAVHHTFNERCTGSWLKHRYSVADLAQPSLWCAHVAALYLDNKDHSAPSKHMTFHHLR